MTEKTLSELVHKELDGATSDKESAELKAYLEKNPRARVFHDELAALARNLRNVSVIDPPRNLKKNIIIAMSRAGTSAQVSRRRPVRSVISDFFTVVRPQFAYAFVAGLLLGIVVYAVLIPREEMDISSLYGTMLSPETAPGFEAGESATFELEQISGTVTLKHSEGVVLADVSLQSQEEAELVLGFDEKQLEFAGFGRFGSEKTTVTVDGSEVHLLNVGENRYVVLFGAHGTPSEPLDLKVFSHGSLVYQRAIPTGQISE